MRRGKKFLRILCLIVAIVISFTTIPVHAETNKTDEEKAIAYLEDATFECNAVMNTICGAWYFQVYKSGDYSSMQIVTDYSIYTGIKKSKIKSIIKENGFSGKNGILACIKNLSSNLSIVHTYFVDNGTFDKIDDDLKKAKKIIKKMEDSDQKTQLKEYYNALNNYYDFVKSPSDSFALLEDKMASLQSAVENCQE
jgi:hypothetical protein